MKVAVLGAGPVGLVAAHAVERFGHSVTVVGIAIPSVIQGAQYIHHEIHELTTKKPEGFITYSKRGTREGYAKKVYGDENAACSWGLFDGKVPAWDILSYYRRLYDRFGPNIRDTAIRGPLIHELLEEFDVVFSSITPQGYCYFNSEEEHVFQWERIRVTPRESKNPHVTVERNEIIYSGDPEDHWYRTANIFESLSTEYPDAKISNISPTPGKLVRKPLMTTCDCFLDHPGFRRIGRYGEFKKELLVTDAYDRVCEEFDEV